MALPAAHALALYRGDSFREQFRLWADTQKTQPIDLTGVAVAAEIRAAPGSAPVLALACVVTGNTIEVSLTSAQSAALNAPAAAYWDLQLTYASGDVQTIVAGGVSIRPNITSSGVRREVVHA